MPAHRNDQDRFWEKVRRTENCWLWTAHTNPEGYGRFGLWATARTMVLAHRFAWEIEHGAIPTGVHVLHHCDTPACVRVTHLFLGTDADNMADKVSKSRQQRGEGVPSSRLTSEQIALIRADCRTQKRIAEDYGVSQSQISRIKGGVQWQHLL